VNARPRLLFLCSTLPYPPDSGQTIRSFHVLRLLARAFDVTALCFYRRTPLTFSRPEGRTMEQDLAQRLAALAPLADVATFPIPQEYRVWRLAWDHLRSVSLNQVYTTFALDSRTFRKRLLHLLQTRRFDLVHMDSITLSGYLPLLGDLPVVCVHHNVESALLQRRSRAERSPWRRAYLLHQARLMDLDSLTSPNASEKLSTRLWRRYGAEALGLLEAIRRDPRQAEVIIETSEYIRCELDEAARREMVVKLEDFLRRRSKIALVVREEEIRAAPGLREACRILFGGDAEAKIAEAAARQGQRARTGPVSGDGRAGSRRGSSASHRRG